MEKKIVKYLHHDVMVNVNEELVGLHRDHCLCFQGCKFFKPVNAENCEIANAVFENCVKFSIVSPVWECPKYEQDI